MLIGPRLVLLGVIALFVGCNSSERVDFFEDHLPVGFPLPEGGELADNVSMGRTKNLRYQYAKRTAAELVTHLRTDLSNWHWPTTEMTSGKGKSIAVLQTRTSTQTLTLRINAQGKGSELLVEIADKSPPPPPPPVRVALKGPPPDYPLGFPFLAGATVDASDQLAGSAALHYRHRASVIAKRLRDRAERSKWSCTQEVKRFICAIGGRTVDVQLKERDGKTKARITQTSP